MPRAKTSNKKGQTKAANAADANGVQNLEVDEKSATDNSALTTLTNGTAAVEDLQEKVAVTKRSSGRAKKEVVEVSEEKKEAKKKPAAKGKGKAKKETPQIEIAEEEPKEEAKVAEKKTKATGGRKKKQETKAEEISEKNINPEETPVEEENETPQAEIVEETPTEKAAKVEKKTKASGGRKKKQEIKAEVIVEENDKAPEEPPAQEGKFYIF